MPSEHRLPEVKKKLLRLGCTCQWSDRGYLKAKRVVGATTYVYPIPTVKGRKVKHCYIRLIQKRLHISPEEWGQA